MVYVYALEPVVVEKPFDPIWVIGTAGDADSLYRIDPTEVEKP